MKFKRYGKAYQLVVNSAKDLPDVLKLDDSHWAVTSAPISAFTCDAQLLKYLDGDNNGRIRTDEMRAAVLWCLETLSDTQGMDQGIAAIDTRSIRKDSPDGASLLVTAGYVSEQMKSEAEVVTLEHVRTCMDELRMKPLNGDGILVPEAAQNAEIADYILAAIAATGGSPDLSGKTGVSAEQLATFKQAIEDFIAWKEKGDSAGAETMPFGDDTHAVWELQEHYAPLIDKFFMLAGFKNFDPENVERFLAAKSASDSASDALNNAPLARPDDNGCLPLSGPAVNPLFNNDIPLIRDKLFAKVLGMTMDSASAEDWAQVKATLALYGAYLASKKGGIVETLPLAKLQAWRESSYYGDVGKLIAADKDVTRRVSAFSQLEKLLLYHSSLLRFINNFVSLSEFYSPDKRAMFERGSAILDGRWFNFAIETVDPAAHLVVAKTSGIFTLYLKVEHRSDPAKAFTVAVPATSGTRGNLSIGKRGVFFDLYGIEHDAVITHIIENPISLIEAVLAPFVKVGKMIMGKIEGLSTTAEDAIMKRADKVTTSAFSATPPPPPAAPASPATLLMSISISIAALGSGFAVLSKSFGEMSMKGRIYSALAAVLMILGPIILGGIIKLARQDLSALLEGCGWAVNQRMCLTGKLRRQFTERRAYPEDAIGTPAKRSQKIVLGLLVLLLFVLLAVS